jgi:hypothetical protein
MPLWWFRLEVAVCVLLVCACGVQLMQVAS